MNFQKSYVHPDIHARTGQVMDMNIFQPEFRDDAIFFGVKNIDAPLVLPMGGVGIMYESDRVVVAIDFISARSS